MVSIKEQLQAEEPDYPAIALLVKNDDELELRNIIETEPAGLAAKATYLLGLVNTSFRDDLLAQSVRHASVLVRIAAAGAMALVDKNFAVVQLKLLLQDQNHSVRKVAIQSVMKLHAVELRSQLDQIRQNDPFPYLRDLANQALILFI